MSKIIDAEDTLNEAQGCVECIYLAGSALTVEDRNPILTVANIVSKKINEAIALLYEYLESGDAEVPAAPDAKPVSRAARTKRSGK